MCFNPTPPYSKYYQGVKTNDQRPTLILRWKGVKLQNIFGVENVAVIIKWNGSQNMMQQKQLIPKSLSSRYLRENSF